MKIVSSLPSHISLLKNMNHSPKIHVVINRKREYENLQNTDDYLMRQFQSGDRDAFTHLVHRHKQNVFQFVLSKVKDRELASDLTQDVFVKLFKSADWYQPTGKFRSWLFRMAQNICIDYYRKHQKVSILSLHSSSETEEELTLVDQIQDEFANPEREAEFVELQKVIESALDSLSEEQRTAFVLCQYQGMSYPEIASVQKVPVGTVKSRIHHALIKVRDFLKENYSM
jgi:RNA polymerase sigma-70 factor (ECF subfamily)